MDDELQALFQAEMLSNLEDFEKVLLQMESEPGQGKLADDAFRVAHNLKGAAGLMEMDALGSLAHSAEELLEDVRSGIYALDVQAITLLLDVGDVCRAFVSSPSDGLVDEAARYEGLLDEHRARLRGDSAGTEEPPSSDVDEPAASGEDAGESADEEPSAQPKAQGGSPAGAVAVAQAPAEVKAKVSRVTRPSRINRVARPPADAVQVAAPATPPPAAPEPPERSDQADAQKVELAPDFWNTEPAGSAEAAPAPAPPQSPAPKPEPAASAPAPPPKPAPRKSPSPKKADSRAGHHDGERTETIRVRVDLLEDLVNYVGELVVARNRLLQLDDRTDSVREENTSRIDELTSSLHSLVMKTRMQPIQTAWSPMPRLVRDVGLELGKRVELEMVGGDTELDRNILANLHDPITHMVRNAVSHGIELPQARLEAGKPEAGTLKLVAYHAAGQVHIEVTDDGRGLDRHAIIDKAVRVGLAQPGELDSRSDDEVFDYLFRPGFSTAEVVDAISGRGVGLDVVRSRIAEMGGAIDVETTLGHGTTLRMRLPLTLAIMPCLIVRCGAEEFCVPQPNLLQILDLETSEGHDALRSVATSHYYELDGEMIPLVRLGQVLHDRPDDEPPRGYAVVVAAGKVRYGIVVDDVLNSEEMVVKPLGVGLEGLDFFSGTTVRGDGKVMLILDIDGLGQSEVGNQPARGTQREELEASRPERALLLCDVADQRRIAIDVESVITVRATVDNPVTAHGDEYVVEYQGRPIALRSLVAMEDLPDELVLVQAQGNIVAIPVMQTLDVVRTTAEISPEVGPVWAEGGILLDGVPTTIVDIRSFGDGRRRQPGAR